VNSQGFFNVPFGDYKKPDWIAESNILKVSKFLSHKSRVSFSTRLMSGDYRQASKLAKPGDFVYFDPPYDPASNTSSFVSYQSGGFTSANQEELRDEILRLTKLGVPVILSNSDTKLIGELYGDKAIFTISRVKVNRAISAKVSGRVAVGEVLVDNFKKIKSIGTK
jgi:DNA adenine methylase